MLRRSQAQPSRDLIERGHHIISVISSSADASGALFRHPGIPEARFAPYPNRSAYSPLNVCGKPDLVLSDPAGGEVLRFRRLSRIPPAFAILGRAGVLGQVKRRSPLRTKYLIKIGTGTSWDFEMPLFSVTSRGTSDAGSSLWVRVGPGKQQWNIVLQPTDDSIILLGALSFIHREWWCYS